MKKRSMHRLHIGGDIWKWYVKGYVQNMSPSAYFWHQIIVVFAPMGKRYEYSIYDLLRFKGLKGLDHEIEAMFEITHQEGCIIPDLVKEYIIKNLQKQDAAWELCRA